MVLAVMTFGSLFAGIGGFDLGLERAGMECRWQVEIDDYASSVLAKHWPHVQRWGDVRTFPPGPADEWRVDLICAGVPCQPVSIAGKRKGKDDDRWMWGECLRIIATLSPRFFLAENPPLFLAMIEAARSPELSPPFKRQGTALIGKLSPLAIWVPRIDEKESSWWRGKSPAWIRCECCEAFICTIHRCHVHDCECPPIEEWAESPYKPRTIWPTPCARDWKGPSWNTPARDCLDHAVERGETKRKKYPTPPEDGGRLNPNWVEWLMGYPIGWTDLGV